MDSELESEEKAIQKPDLRRRIRLSFWLLLLLVAIIGWRVFIVRLPIEGPSWYGLTVGQSTTEDVIAVLGEPAWIRVRLVTGTVYHYEEWIDDNWGHPIIYFRNNQVIRIRVRSIQDTTVWTFVDQYGKPDLITDEIEVHSTLSPKGVYWLDEGIYLSVMVEDNGKPNTIIFFRPCPPRFDDEFCVFVEQWNFDLGTPGEDPWGIMSPLPTPILTPIP